MATGASRFIISTDCEATRQQEALAEAGQRLLLARLYLRLSGGKEPVCYQPLRKA